MSRFFRQAGDSDSESSDSDDELMSSGDDDVPQKPVASTSAKPAMSRFLRTAGSDSSDSDSDEDSDSDSDAPRRSGLPLRDESGDEGEDDADAPGARIKSASERRLDEMKATGKLMENALRINDWVAISNGMHYL
jgi:translation initiation factor 3 subunit C